MVSVSATLTGGRTSRLILVGSLALNLFFVGLLGAGAVRHLWRPSSLGGFEPSRTAAERIDRLASTLPPHDADKLRAEFRVRETAVQAAHAAYRNAQQAIRTALRAEPFDDVALRSAMSDTRGARQNLDLALQDVIAAAALQMSPAGRRELANWTPAAHKMPPTPQ